MKKFFAVLLAALILLSSTGLAYSYYFDPYDLYYYELMPVVTRGRGNLVFQREPRGSFMSSYSYTDGDWIWVHPTYREGNYALAYENGVYGYVDASYINWDYYCNPVYSSASVYDLCYYDYYRVVTNGRGALVFQREPRGAFLSSHKFYDGDWILVNPYYREGNYALAYENGTYGYVDASYIDW